MWATILNFLSSFKVKDALYLLVGLTALSGVFSFGWSVRSCHSSKEFEQTVKTMTDNQISALQETAETARVLITTNKEMLAEWGSTQDALSALKQEYEAKLANLEAAMIHRDEQIKTEFAEQVKERAARLREDYEKIINDPEAARDAFYNSLHLWDDFWSAGPGQ